MPIKKHIPNILSTIRLFMTCGLPYAFTNFGTLAMAIYYAIGNGTDAIDGFLARRWKAQSKYGKVVDPIADKSFNIVSLFFISSLINPLLLVLLLPELLIATIAITHTIHNIKKTKIDTGKMKLFDKIYLFFDVSERLNVSRLGRKKAVVMGIAMLLMLLIPIIPALFIPALILVGLAAILELPVLVKYALAYRREKGMLSNSENKLLDKLNHLDDASDKLDRKIINAFKKVVKPAKKKKKV